MKKVPKNYSSDYRMDLIYAKLAYMVEHNFKDDKNKIDIDLCNTTISINDAYKIYIDLNIDREKNIRKNNLVFTPYKDYNKYDFVCLLHISYISGNSGCKHYKIIDEMEDSLHLNDCLKMISDIDIKMDTETIKKYYLKDITKIFDKILVKKLNRIFKTEQKRKK